MIRGKGTDFIHQPLLLYLKMFVKKNSEYCESLEVLTRVRIQRRVTGLVAAVAFPAGTGIYSRLHSVQIGSGAHPASYPIPGCEAHSSSPCRTEVKNGGAIPSLPHVS
jgi:hypothetical protein